MAIKKLMYGTATAEEINAGFHVAMEIAKIIKAVKNPAVQNMIKELVTLVRVKEAV